MFTLFVVMSGALKSQLFESSLVEFLTLNASNIGMI